MDHWTMLRWAERNLEALKADHAAFMRRQPYSLWSKDYLEGQAVIPDGGEVPVYIPSGGQQIVELRLGLANVRPIDDLPLKVGDIIHNLRVSLDYLATAIAMRHNAAIFDDKKKAFGIAFPICAKKPDWAPLRKRICLDEWASPDAIKWIEAAQPYSRPQLANLDPLLLLHRLENPHKHKRLLAAAPNVTYIDFSAFDPLSRFEPVSFGLEGPFVDGAVVARGRFVSRGKPIDDVGPQPNAKVNFEVTFDIAFDDAGPAPRYPVFVFFTEITNFIRHGVFPKLEPYA